MTFPPRYALFFLYCAGIASLACVVTGFASLNRTPVFEVVDLPGNTASNAGNQPNQDLLLPAPLQSLPLGAVRAEGWLASQLELMVTGQTGHLDEISPYLQSDSGWLGGNERGWEEAPYWLRGLVQLAVLSEDSHLREVTDKWMEAVLASQLPDGYYGSARNRNIKQKNGSLMVDIWPNVLMNDALILYFQATGDKRIVPFLTKFFSYCRDLPEKEFLPEITWDIFENFRENLGVGNKRRVQLARAGDMVPQLIWLYGKTGEKWLLDFALEIHHRTLPSMNQWVDKHTVNFSQRFRYPAQLYPITGDSRYLEKSDFLYDSFMSAWGQMPRGAHAANEAIRSGKIDAGQGFETCSMCELNHSHYILAGITGNPKYADKVEDITFNHLPAALAPDLRSLRYFTASNMPYSVPGMDYQESGLHTLFATDLHRCCQHNVSMSWPSFVRNLWQRSSDNGLVAWMYSPNRVTAEVGHANQRVTVHTETIYPFGDQLRMNVRVEEAVTFPLYVRIPGWCESMTISIAGFKQEVKGKAGDFLRVVREWVNGDVLFIHFDMDVSATKWPRSGAITLDRGPLSYSIRIKEKWTLESGGLEKWPRWSLTPDSPWNYGLYLDPNDPARSTEVIQMDLLDGQPWSEANAPIVLRVPARRIPEWNASFKNTVDPVREGPVRSDAEKEIIELIPMGCARLRMSVLPVISDRGDARYWSEIPDPNNFMWHRIE